MIGYVCFNFFWLYSRQLSSHQERLAYIVVPKLIPAHRPSVVCQFLDGGKTCLAFAGSCCCLHESVCAEAGLFAGAKRILKGVYGVLGTSVNPSLTLMLYANSMGTRRVACSCFDQTISSGERPISTTIDQTVLLHQASACSHRQELKALTLLQLKLRYV